MTDPCNFMKYDPNSLQKFGFIKRDAVDFININPLQTGGRLTRDAQKALLEWGDGYSVCDNCDGVLDLIKKPPIEEFVHKALPEFLGVDAARVTNGARESKFAVYHTIGKPGDYVVMDCLAHYSSRVAVERCGMQVRTTRNVSSPEYQILPEHFAEAIDSGISEFKKKPVAVQLTYPDGNYGNLSDVYKIGSIAHEYDIPFLLNCAYSVGRMPLNAKKMGADFIVGSGHKSMASCGPIGVLGIVGDYADDVFRKSSHNKAKEIELLGCTSRGAPIMTMIASFPEVLRRSQPDVWDGEVKKARNFIKRLTDTGKFELCGQRPHMHDLMFFVSNGFYNISKREKNGRFFLYKELKEKKIHGIRPGLTRNFKISTYGLPDEHVSYVADTFEEILLKYGEI